MHFSKSLTCGLFANVQTISVGAGKFLGVRRIFARIFLNLPERFLCDFACKFSPTKIMKTFCWHDLQKKSFTFGRWAQCFEIKKTLGAIFAPIFRHFAPVFRDSAQIFRNFAWMFDKSELPVMRLHLASRTADPDKLYVIPYFDFSFNSSAITIYIKSKMC